MKVIQMTESKRKANNLKFFPSKRLKKMFSAVIKFFKGLEDPERPCFGPHIWFLKFHGLWHPELKTLKSRIKLVLCYITIIFFCSQYIRCVMSFSGASLQLILQYLTFHMGVVKTIFFQKDHDEWVRLINDISEVEVMQRSTGDEKTQGIMKQYIKRTRQITYLCWGLCFFFNIFVFSEPYQKNQIVENGTSVYIIFFDGYTPFEKEPPGYYFSMVIQTVVGLLMNNYIVCWDTLTVSIMIFFAGQLKISRWYCTQAIDQQSKVRSQKNIAECHRFHTRLVRHQKKFNDLISSVMFIYLIVISVNLGMVIIEIAKIADDVQTLISGCIYVVAILFELLIFYWHSNEVTVDSLNVSYGTFESKWTDADKSLQKEIALLSLTTRKRLVFSAGPLNEMSLATFVTILRRSYSFFTLMKETN